MKMLAVAYKIHSPDSCTVTKMYDADNHAFQIRDGGTLFIMKDGETDADPETFVEAYSPDTWTRVYFA